ncbi:MAG TPA: hypothetical protein VEQ38_06835 [Verrucomicrobiae bacterium]|nr:hypothetical protein [Verrucomicrobiae bacterium]
MHSGLPLLLGAANIIDEGRIEIGATKCELLLNRLELLGKNSRIAEFLTPEQKAKVEKLEAARRNIKDRQENAL